MNDKRTRQRWLREVLFFDGTYAPLDPAERDRRLAIIKQRASARAAKRVHRRRLGRWTAAGCVVGLAAGGVAVAVLRSEQPTRPEAGITCRVEARPDASAIVLSPAADPVQACRDAWEDGPGAARPVPDELTACVGGRGGIEVFPGPAAVCQQLDLILADTGLSPENVRIVELSERIATELNAGDCRPTSEVESSVITMLVELQLADWTVQPPPGAGESDCAKVGLDSVAKTITLLTLQS